MITDEAVQTWELAFSGPPRLEFRGESGDVVLRAAAPGEPCRLELSGPRAEKVTVQVRTGGSRVSVNAESRGDPSRGGAVFTFTVPRDLHASIASDFGGITAEGLGPCDLDLSTDLGSLRLRDVCGRLRLKSEVGQIEVTGMAHGDLEARTETGAIRLVEVDGRIAAESETGEIMGRGVSGMIAAQTEYGSVTMQFVRPDHGEHVVRSESGSVEVEIPRDVAVRLELEVEDGSVRSDYRSRPDAPAVLRATTERGSIRIREGMAIGAQTVGGLGRSARPESEATPTSAPSTPRSSDEGRPFDYDAELARILTLVAAGELSARDANELLEALRAGR